ncbi:MAG: 2-succinyl-5-enolpyruvyl-6-hydroxy-3-cyclohexene-1-carboxylic-acid synthase [Acidimicrobiia bacterium]
MDVNTSFARTVVDQFVRDGVREAVVAPGSRSAPLTLAIANDARLRLHVVVDERSAAFVALGIGKATGVPALLVCTSGTAAAHFHPAVLEASHAAVPMIVLTADRPPELIGVGAPQTIDQTNLFGGAVRYFSEPGPPEDHEVGADGARGWRVLARTAYRSAVGSHPGPVHLNLGFREPLIPSGDEVVLGRPLEGGEPAAAVVRPIDIALTPKSLVIAGDGATDSLVSLPSGVPIFADPLSGLRGEPNAITTFEALLRAGLPSELMPDQVVRLGGLPASSNLGALTGLAVPQVGVVSRGRRLDPTRAVTEWIDAPVEFAGEVDQEWANAWTDAERRARAALDAHLLGRESLDGCAVAALLPTIMSPGSIVTLNSSMAIREWEWVMPRSDVSVLSNRGVNGIDGFIATSCGVALASGEPVVGITGDLGFLHDVGSLATLASLRLPSVKIIVNDNDGGGIFEFLPPRTLDEFEQCFGTPHGLDLAQIVAGFGVGVSHVSSRPDLAAFLSGNRDGISVAIMSTDRQSSRALAADLFVAAIRGFQEH